MKNNNGISRRDFLKGAAAGAASLAVMGMSKGVAFAEEEAAGGLTAEKALGKWEFEIPPAPIPEDQIAEVIEDDIIIIGSGMSGLTTAVSAAQNGASVTLFSASSHPISRGGSNFAKNSKVMEERGIEPFDVNYFFYHEMRAASFQVDQKKWNRGYNNSEEAMNWLIDLVAEDGLKVILERDNDFDGGPHYAHAFNTEGNDAMVSTGQQGAVESLERHAKDLGVKFYYDHIGRQLIREDDNKGRVTGAIAQRADGSYVKFVGKKAIVLATGEFSGDKQMLAKYCPMVIPLIGLDPVEVDYNTGFGVAPIYNGDGQKMGLWIGAAWQHAYPNAPMMQGSWGGSHEPLGFHWGLNVNARTERYQREDVSAPYSANHLISQPGHIAWGIWTANYAQAIIDAGHEWYSFGSNYDNPPKTVEELLASWDAGSKADTIEDLAAQCNLDAEKLKAVIKRYNELCEKGVDEDFHKNPDFMIPIDENGPFYYARNGALFMTVMGGLRCNEFMQVQDENDEPIPGLFEVGQMIGDMYANTYNFAIPGNSYGINCLTFGYLLGRDLATGKFD